MPWLSTSKALIWKHKAYNIGVENLTTLSLSQLLDQQMDNVNDNAPFLIPIIEADLATLETLDVTLTTEKGSTSGALIRADVLEWSDKAPRTASVDVRYNEIRDRIARMLSQAIADDGCNAGGWGMGTLMRG